MVRLTQSMGRVSNKPIISTTSPDDQYNLDVEIRKLKEAMPKPTVENCEWCYRYEPQITSFTKLTGSMIIGKDIRVVARRLKDQKKVNSFNDAINTRGESIHDLWMKAWEDNIKFADSLHRVWMTDQVESGTDLCRIDPQTIDEIKHPETGFSLFIQTATRWTKKSLNAEDYNSFFNSYKVDENIETETVTVKIPNDIHSVVRFKFFDHPPMESLVPLVIFKKWIIWYIRKHAQKFWSPYTIATLGNENYMPSDTEYTLRESELNAILPDMYNFSGMCIPGWIKVEQLQSTTSKDGQLYPTYIDLMNREMINGLYGSMNLREGSSGSGAGKSEISKNWLGFAESVRAQFVTTMRMHYAYNVCGDAKPEDFDVMLPPVRIESLIDVIASAKSLGEMEICDEVELRQAVYAAYPYIDPKKVIKAHVSETNKVKLAIGTNKPPGTQKEPATRPRPARSVPK